MSTGKAKGIPSAADPAGQPPDGLSPSLVHEIGASLERVLRLHKAETVGGAVDRSRSTIYAWAAHPEHVPVAALLVLATFDPDPEFLARVAGHLMAEISTQAMRRHAAGRALLVINEISPGRWGR
jgi:hypothetical protein